MLQSKNDNAIYPLIAIASSIVIFVGSLLTATHHGYYYFLVISLLLIAFKMWRQYLTILPYGIIVSSIFFGICYAITKNVEYSIAGCLRIAGLCIAIVPSSSIPPVNLTRALNQLKCPRALCLGILITIKFFPMLNDEIKQIRMAMKTRGATNSLCSCYLMFNNYWNYIAN